MTLDTRFALFAVLHEPDSGTPETAAMSAISPSPANKGAMLRRLIPVLAPINPAV